MVVKLWVVLEKWKFVHAQHRHISKLGVLHSFREKKNIPKKLQVIAELLKNVLRGKGRFIYLQSANELVIDLFLLFLSAKGHFENFSIS